MVRGKAGGAVLTATLRWRFSHLLLEPRRSPAGVIAQGTDAGVLEGAGTALSTFGAGTADYSGQQRYDQLGSTRAMTDTVGTVTARYTYDAYGNPTPGSSAADSRFGYAGQHTDHASGLIYMRARWYDPRTGAFLPSDPIGHASGETNLYRYAGGDPINAIDPSGLILGIPGTPSGEDISNHLQPIAPLDVLPMTHGATIDRRLRDSSSHVRPIGRSPGR